MAATLMNPSHLQLSLVELESMPELGGDCHPVDFEETLANLERLRWIETVHLVLFGCQHQMPS